MGIPAFYFDGKTSRKLTVELSVEAGIALIAGDIQRDCPIDALRVSERVRNAARKVTFPDGAYLEVLDNIEFNALLAATGYQDSFVVRMQQSWRATLIACVITIAILILGYAYGLPAASEAIAKALPEKIERAIGRETLAFLDQLLLLPSKLSAERRNAIVGRFKTLAPPKQGVPAY